MKGCEILLKTLTEKDYEDSRAILELFETLSEEHKNQCIIYISALRDRQIINEQPQSVKE